MMRLHIMYPFLINLRSILLLTSGVGTSPSFTSN